MVDDDRLPVGNRKVDAGECKEMENKWQWAYLPRLDCIPHATFAFGAAPEAHIS